MNLEYDKSPFGLIEIEADEDSIVGVRFTDCIKSTKNHNVLTSECYKQLVQYCSKKRTIFELPIKLQGTEFQQKVWEEVRKIPYGETRTYQEIARNIGNEKAVRAVGAAIGKNPIAIIVPCHRVIGSNGAMTGYAYGIDKKEKLLAFERKKA